MLGKQDNCQVAVSVRLACQTGSLPLAWQLYLPKDWAEDLARRHKAGVADELEFATKPAIALAQIERLMAQGAPRHCVLADAGYGVEAAFRERLSELGLPYVVGVTGQVTAWPPGHRPLPPAAYSGHGVVPTRLRVGDAQHSTARSRSRNWRWSWRRRNGRPSSGAKAAISPCALALPEFVCARLIASNGARNCVPKNGFSSSGPKATRSR
jgi:SRSO17 transposase